MFLCYVLHIHTLLKSIISIFSKFSCLFYLHILAKVGLIFKQKMLQNGFLKKHQYLSWSNSEHVNNLNKTVSTNVELDPGTGMATD